MLVLDKIFPEGIHVPDYFTGKNIVPLPTIIGPNPALKVTLGFVHIYLNYTLLALVAMHLMAVLKHQFVDHDGLLARMIPFLR